MKPKEKPDKGDLVYIQFPEKQGHGPGHLFKQDAIFGQVILKGKSIKHPEKPNYDEESKKRADREHGKYERLSKGMYDPEHLDQWGMKYSNEDGERILINGVELAQKDVGVLGIIAETRHFTKLNIRHIDDIIMFHTAYLRIVGAEIFILLDEIRRGIKDNQRDCYQQVVDIMAKAFEGGNGEDNTLIGKGISLLGSQKIHQYNFYFYKNKRKTYSRHEH